MLIIPLGIIGAISASLFAGYENDIYLQVGMLTTMGLSAKNAILIVDLALAQFLQGKSLSDATFEATHLRLRPLIMTSLAFVVAVIPLVLSSGAGAASLQEIVTVVIGEMLKGTLLTLLFVPLFFLRVQQGIMRLKSRKQ